jgi:uncharacterized protein (DUF305 family)
MIDHHQVAIDMSHVLYNYTKEPQLTYLARNIIFSQTNEITYMKRLLESKLSNISTIKNEQYNLELKETYIKYYYPNLTERKNVKCEGHFFSLDKKHLEHYKCNKLTDKEYIDHMISHHQIAVDMSRKLLKTTNNMQITSFCYHIISAQEYEIFLMNQMCGAYKYHSPLLD